MILSCYRCLKPFENAICLGYCPECLANFQEAKKRIRNTQQPGPGLFLDGKFCTEEPPHTVTEPTSGKQVCGLCGSDQVNAGYGLGSGYGLGTYNFCEECNSFLDCVEDLGE